MSPQASAAGHPSPAAPALEQPEGFAAGPGFGIGAGAWQTPALQVPPTHALPSGALGVVHVPVAATQTPAS